MLINNLIIICDDNIAGGTIQPKSLTKNLKKQSLILYKINNKITILISKDGIFYVFFAHIYLKHEHI
jgi:cell division GTPase FtsZ